MWFKDYEGINKRRKHLFVLTRTGNKTYQYSNSSYFPLDCLCFGSPLVGYTDHNYGFTEEMSICFQYDGSGSITISGDDDIWVFINGILAVDMGGCHTARSSQVSLTGVDQTQNVNGREVTYKYNETFDIVEGQHVYIKIFHAKRKAGYSTFSLTLNGLDVVTEQ